MTLEDARERFRKVPAANPPHETCCAAQRQKYHIKYTVTKPIIDESTMHDARRLSESASRIVREMQSQINVIYSGQLKFDEI